MGKADGALALASLLLAARCAAQDLGASIDQALADHYKPRDPGATVIVVKDGVTVFRKAYGMADLRRARKLRPEYSMRLGSLTKQFTAAAVLLLAENGKLALTDSVSRFLPDYPAASGTRITIEHLLTHTSGIPNYSNQPGYGANSYREQSVGQMIDRFKDAALEFEPGTRFAYSNSGYFLLGAIIEKVSGQPYASFVARHLFSPLGMQASAYEGQEHGSVPAALGYTLREGEFVPAPQVSMSQAYAAGAIRSSVDDLARWDAAIAAGAVLKPSSWRLAMSSARLADGSPTGYGYGWIVTPFQGTPAISHGGGIDGFFAYVLRLPEHKVFVAVLSNADAGVTPAHVIAFKAAAVAMGKPLAARP
ncbi:MAG: serine hydrolase domain-containing protein [Pseudomonadota bacterium]